MMGLLICDSLLLDCSFVAGKAYYFGVGGSMRQFEELAIKDGVFKVQVVWRSNEGKTFFNMNDLEYI